MRKHWPALNLGPSEGVLLQFVYIPPDNRRYELYNLDFRMESVIQGVCDYLDLEREAVKVMSRLSFVPTPRGCVRLMIDVIPKPKILSPGKPYKSGTYRSPGQRAERP